MINNLVKDKFVEEALMAINNSGEAGTNLLFKKRLVEEDLKRFKNHERVLLQEQARMQNWFSTRPVREYMEHLTKALGSVKVCIMLMEQWQSVVEMEISVAQKVLDASDVYHGEMKDMPVRKRKREKSPDEDDGLVSV